MSVSRCMLISLYSWHSEKFNSWLLLRIFNAVYVNRKHHARIFVSWIRGHRGTPVKGARKHAEKLKDDRIQRLYMCLTKPFAGYFWLTQQQCQFIERLEFEFP